MIIDVLNACGSRHCDLAPAVSEDVTDLVRKAYIAGYCAGALGLPPEISQDEADWIRGRSQPALP